MSRYPRRIISRNASLTALNGYGADKSDRSIDLVINRLRHMLRTDPRQQDEDDIEELVMQSLDDPSFLILKCEALAAAADYNGIDRVLVRVYTQVPQIKTLMEVLFTNPETPSKAAQQELVGMLRKQARGMLL